MKSYEERSDSADGAGRSAHRRRTIRPRRTILTITVVASMAFGLSACGGGSPPGVASVGSTTTTAQAASAAAAGSSGNAKYRAALAYVKCMRSHGVPNMPDPAANGTLNVDFATGGKDGAPVSSGINRNSSQYISADQTCRHLLPNGGVPTPAQTQQALSTGVKFAQCMRSHGVPNYPDPNPADPDVVHLVGVDLSSPQFQNAQKACQTLVPGSGSK